MTHIAPTAPEVRYETTTPSIIVENLQITDPSVLAESRHWSGGRRGPGVSEAEMNGVDLTAYVIQALAVGAQAISSAGGVQDTYNLENLVSEVGSRTASAATRAAELTGEAVTQAGAAMLRASDDARKAIIDAGQTARKSFTDNVDGAQKQLADEMTRLFGGDRPELLARVTPLLAKFSNQLDEKVAVHTSELLAKAARQFDPSDPTSPMAKHASTLTKQHQELATAMATNHQSLAGKVARSAQETAGRFTRATPLKGQAYEQQINLVMADIAAGLGDEYRDTGTEVGSMSMSKKGDGLLTIGGGEARVVLEMTDSARADWNKYLELAERNRKAAASLGLVRSADQLGGNGIRCFSQRRIVMAFDPETDDPGLLRTVIQLLRLSAQSTAARDDAGEVETALEKITEAMSVLEKIDSIKSAAALIKRHAEKVDSESDSLRSSLNRLLSQAESALKNAPAGIVSGAAA